jgi:hypothetical protein
LENVVLQEFVQITGLLSAFAAGRDAGADKKVSEFMAWLIEHNHKDVLQQINRNSQTLVYIKAYLNNELPEIQSKLDTLTLMVEELIKSSLDEEDVASSYKKAYEKNVLILHLQRDIVGGSVTDVDEALRLINDWCESAYYNKYVLAQIVRECIANDGTAYEIVNKHWYALSMPFPAL